MKLTISQRIQLENFISQQKGTVGQIRAFGRILDQLGINDEDGVKRINLPGGFVRFEFEPGDEPREFSLKPQDLELLKSSLEAWGGFQPADMAWLEPLLEQM